MEGKADNKGDATSSVAPVPVFTSADKMRFSSLSYEIIEELKMRRELAAENEKKIEKLLNERFNMGWKLDQECCKVANLSERHEAELRETRRQLEEKMRDCQVDASQQQVYRKMAEKEKDALKDEIRRLQLANYSLEKKVRESERQEKIQANEREQHIRQVSRFESQYSQIDVVIKQLTSKQDQLDRDMKLVQNLNRSLQYQNSHQKCILDLKEADLVQVQQQLLDTQVKVKVEPTQVQEREDELQGEVKRLKNLVKKLEEDYDTMDKDKDCWKEKYWDSLKKLDDSHRLINVHLHNAARYREECDNMEKVQKATQDMLDETEQCLTQSRKEMDQIRQKHRDEVEIFEAQASKLNAEIADLNAQVHDLSTQKEGIEKSLGKADEDIAELEKQLADVKAILNVEKFHKESQTDLQMLLMLHREVQATPLLQNQEAQIEVQTGTGITQTIDPALCSTEVQTDIAVTKATETQTELQLEVVKSIEDAVTQTELEKFDRSLPTKLEEQTNEDSGVKLYNKGKERDIIYIEDSPKKGKANIAGQTEHISIELVNEESEGLNTVQDSGRVKEDVGNEKNKNMKNEKVDSLNISETIDLEETRDIKPEKANINFANEAKTDTTRSVNLEEMKEFNISTGNKDRIGRFRFRNTDSNHNGMDENDKGNLVTRLNLNQGGIHDQDDEIKSLGLSIPKIDIDRSIDRSGVVSIDPDEFSIELTQDERPVDVVSNHTSKEISYENDNDCTVMDTYSGKERRLSDLPKSGKKVTASVMEKNEIEKSIEQNWEVAEEPVKITKSKAKKHKLTKEVVNDQFSNFDISKEKFEKFLSRDEVHPKQPKLIEMGGYRTRGFPKRQRNYSSMFQIDDEVEKVDESDTEELVPKTDLDGQACHAAATKEVQCPSNVVNSMKNASDYLINSDSQYSNHCAISQPSKQSNKELDNEIVFPGEQSSSLSDNQTESNQTESENQQESNDCLNNGNMCGTSNPSNWSVENSVNSIVQPMYFAKPLLDPAEINNVKNPKVSPKLHLLLHSFSKQVKETEHHIHSSPKGNVHSTVSSVSYKDLNSEPMESSSRNLATVTDSPAYRRRKSASFDTTDTTVLKSASSHAKCSIAKCSRPAVGAVAAAREVDHSSSGIDVEQAASKVSSLASSTKPTNVTAASNAPDVLNQHGKSESSTNFLQKYRDIVAKIKPVQHSSCHQPKVTQTQKNTGHGMTSPGNITISDFGRKVSPRGITPRGILKGTSRNNRKSRNVTWNEYVMNKDYVKDENTPEDK